MRLDVLRRLKPPASSPSLLRAAWKYGLGLGVAAVLLTAGGVDRVQPNGHPLASTVLPTTVPCGQIAEDSPNSHTATWTATMSPYGTGSPYNLPVSTTNNTDPLVTPCDAVVVPADFTLKIDASQGPVHIFSHGAAIQIDGGHLLVLGKDEINSVLFDAEPDVASWIGITVNASDATHLGNASLAFASIQHALNSITITSGATATPDPTNLTSQLPYGLALVNSGIGPSYFDGIDAIDTPVSVKGQAAGSPSRADGKFGTVNNIGSQGIKFNWGPAAPALPANALALKVDSVAFGSSVPFAETGCLPLQLPCSAGSIGNDAILANFTSLNPPSVSIIQSRFYRAGSFGVELNSPNLPLIKDNNFDCNGTGSPKPKETCLGTGLKYSAIYLNQATVDLENSVTNNVGHEDGLDAIVLNGTVVYKTGLTSGQQIVTWKNATNDPSSETHQLGYLLDGNLNLASGTLKLRAGDVVKSRGTINLTGAALDASDTSSSSAKLFTSLRDNVNIPTCPSVFVQSCPTQLPGGEWGGINLVGSRTDATLRSATKSTIINAKILYATTGVHITNGDSLLIQGSVIGPTFADGVLSEGSATTISGTTFGCPIGVCSGISSGNHGILADFRNAGPLTGGLKVGGPTLADGNTFQGSVNEAIRAVGLAGVPVDIQNNAIQSAGATGTAGSAGIYLQGADTLILKRNDVVGSGTGNLHYPAIWLDGVSQADFNGPISGNTGSTNGLNAIAFHGDTKVLTWQSVAATGPLGFIVDGNLLVAGDLTMNNAYAPVVAGTIAVQGGTLTTTNATVTSLKEQTQLVPSCGSVFVPKASGVCAPATAGDWGGLVLDPARYNRLTDSVVRYAATGLSVGLPTGSRAAQNLTLTNTSITNSAGDGVSTLSPGSITDGAFTNNGAHAIRVDLKDVVPSTLQPLVISGSTIGSSGQEGILATGLSGQTATVKNVSVDRSGAFGINLKDGGKDLTVTTTNPPTSTTYHGHLTLTNNTVTNSAATFPAIYLNGFLGPIADVSDNKGASNGVDAIAFHGTVTDDLAWKTARKTGDPTRPLGYILDNTLTMQSGHTLTVNGGDIVKVGNGGLLNLQGVSLVADDTTVGSQKVFTSLTDDTVGVATCQSAVVTGCTLGAPHVGDWGGISLTGSGANGTLVNAAVRNASSGIVITGGPPPSVAAAFSLVVSDSSIGPTAVDGISAPKTPISVTRSSFSGGTHGISVDFSGATPGSTPLRLSGNRFVSTSAEAILGQALGGQPVWITDNRVQGAATYGIRLLNADQLVLRNNNVIASGGGPSAGAGRYPAIFLPAVSADFAANIRGNVGSGNGLDALVFDGTVTGDLAWITPSNAPSKHALGYLLDGGLTFQGKNFTVGSGDVVKSLGGPITINGGKLTVTGAVTGGSQTSRSAIFTSLKDSPMAPALPDDRSDAAAVSCPSVLVSTCSPGPGDWGGLVITSNAAGDRGNGDIAYGLINYANTGISLDSGPIAASPKLVPSNFRLTVRATTIKNASKDGINSLDTPFSVKDSITMDPSKIQNVGANGIIASFFSPANCSSTSPPVSPCIRMEVRNVEVTVTGKDGIIANGLSGQPTVISDNTITNAGTYGIRLVGADQLTLTTNHIRKSVASPLRYPAIYLSSVKADFEVSVGAGPIIQGNDGRGNGIDAIVFHGEATKKFVWITAALPTGSGDVTFGYLLDGPLVVDGDFVSGEKDIVKIMNGGIKITGGGLQSLGTKEGTTFTSLKDNPGLPACNSVFIPDACPTVATNADWFGISIDGTNSVFQYGKLLYATSGVTINSATLTLTSTLITGLTGYAVTTTGTGIAQVDCASIHGNGGGISSNGAATTAVTYSNLFGNNSAGKDFDATVASTATNDWWGQAPPVPPSHYAGPVTIHNALPQEPPTFMLGGATVAFSSNNTNSSNGKFGKGTLTVTLTADREIDPTANPTVTFQGPTEAGSHTVTGAWKTDNLTWQGTASIDKPANEEGKNILTISGAKSCVPDGTNVMPSAETGPFFYLNFGAATFPGPGSAQNVGSKSATFTESVNPRGWSNQKDTYVFFQYRLDSGAYDASVIAGLKAGTVNPTTLFGYQTIDHGAADVPVTAQVSQLLTPGTVYDYRVVAVDLNDIVTGPDRLFTTLGPLDHFAIAAIASPQTAGTAFSVQATAYDLGGNVLTDYLGTSAVLSGNLSTAPAGNCSGPGTACPPKYGTQSWSAGVGTISGLAAYVAEDNRTLTITDGLVSKTSGTFKVNSTGTETMLWFTTPAQSFTAGLNSGTIMVAQTDAYANPIAAAAPITVTLTTNSGTGGFRDDVTNAPIATVTIPLGNSSAAFKYTDTAAGSPQITATAGGLTAATQTETVTP